MMVIIYGKTICPNCTKVRGVLDRAGIEYRYINLEDDLDSYNKIKDFGLKQVPILELDGEILGGIDNLQKILEWNNAQ